MNNEIRYQPITLEKDGYVYAANGIFYIEHIPFLFENTWNVVSRCKDN